MGSLAGCGGSGGGGGATFTTSIPGNKPLGGLSDTELATLCSDGAAFAADPANKMDACRLLAFLETALTQVFSTGGTDVSLQMSCAATYNQCLNPSVDGGAGSVDGGAGSVDGGAGPSCMRPPANCTATVAEYTACVNDQTAQTRAAASEVPACSSVTLANVALTDGGTGTTSLTEPASCQLVQLKCSGLSDTAQSFIDQYCALVAPCCAKAGLTSDCALTVTSAAQQATYDATAGMSCLAALTVQKSDANFCGGLAVITGSQTPWAVIPACAPAFQSAGVTAAGQACNTDSDCAPGPNGGAICLRSLVPGDGGGFTSTQTCQLLTGKVGVACFGTYFNGGTESNPSLAGALCDQSQGVMCDDQPSTAVGSPLTSGLCVAGGAPGASCNSNSMCDPAAAYCNFAAGGICVMRLPLGAICTGTLFSECAGNAYCNDTSKKCTALGGAGAACSPSTYPSDCLSGFCNGGTCTNPLSQLCQ
jgi:hypothetical protein